MTTERARLITATICGAVITVCVLMAIFAAHGARFL